MIYFGFYKKLIKVFYFIIALIFNYLFYIKNAKYSNFVSSFQNVINLKISH